MFFAIWYHLYNLKNVKNTHRGVLPLVNFQPATLLKSPKTMWKLCPSIVFLDLEIR